MKKPVFVRGVPYRIIGGVRFYDRKEIKDLMAYVRLIYQPDDLVSFSRIVNVPTRGLGKTSIDRFLRWIERNGLTLSSGLSQVAMVPELTPRAQKGLAAFGELLERLRDYAKEARVSELIEATINRSGYLEWVQDGSVQGETRAENVREFVSVAKEYDDLGLAGWFLEEVALVADVDSYDAFADALVLMTIHAAKGLEFPVVIMTGLEENVFPHSRALYDMNQMEEERRLCYVGMTRAREELYMVHAARRLLFGDAQHNPPSRFLSDIDNEVSSFGIETSSVIDPGYNPWDQSPSFDTDQEAVELQVGDRVKHKVFGEGTVSQLDGSTATIAFISRGPKKLNVEFAPLEKLS